MNRKEILLSQLSEECAEIAQDVSKALRFGTDNTCHNSGKTNAEKITSEMNDLMGVFFTLCDEGILPNIDMGKVEEKRFKIEHFMKVSLSLKNDKNIKYRIFCDNLKGMDCYRDDKKIPKYILFWSGYNSGEIKAGITDIKVIKR